MNSIGSCRTQWTLGVTSAIETLTMNRGHTEASQAAVVGTRVDCWNGVLPGVMCSDSQRAKHLFWVRNQRIWPQLCHLPGPVSPRLTSGQSIELSATITCRIDRLLSTDCHTSSGPSRPTSTSPFMLCQLCFCNTTLILSFECCGL